MMLIVNLNLALDHVIVLDQLEPAAVHRAKAAQTQAGGKGVNVARALKAFRLCARVTGFLGGWRAGRIRAGLREEAIPFDTAAIAGASRTCLILLDRQKRKTTVINEPGPSIARHELDRWFDRYRRWLPQAEAVLVSGSFPPGVPPQAARRILDRAREAGKPTFLDTSGRALAQAVKAPPYLLKINRSETEALIGAPIRTPGEAQQAAAHLLSGGTRIVVITLGRRGAVLATAEATYFFRALPGQGWNDVGCGDAMLAGLAAAHGRGLPPVAMGRWAIATATASLSRGFGRVTAGQIRRLLPQVRHRRLA